MLNTQGGFTGLEQHSIDRLGLGSIRVYQNPEIFKFTIDPILVASFLRAPSDASVLDLGTGGGAIPLWLVGYRGFRRVVGLELQPEPAAMARESVALNGFTDQISIVEGDLRESPVNLLGESYTWIVSNPPYLPGNSRLTGNPTLDRAKFEMTCTLEDLAKAAHRLSGGNGRLVMVHLPERLPDIFETLRRYHFEPKLMRLVHSGPNKPPNRVLIEAQKSGKPHLRVLSPLFIHDENGEFSMEMQRIYQGSPMV